MIKEKQTGKSKEPKLNPFTQAIRDDSTRRAPAMGVTTSAKPESVEENATGSENMVANIETELPSESKCDTHASGKATAVTTVALAHGGNLQLMTMKEVCALVGLSDKMVYRLIAKGLFPRQLKLGSASRWIASEVNAWLKARIEERDKCQLPHEQKNKNNKES